VSHPIPSARAANDSGDVATALAVLQAHASIERFCATLHDPGVVRVYQGTGRWWASLSGYANTEAEQATCYGCVFAPTMAAAVINLAAHLGSVSSATR
jgi:hypothetical protein